MLFPTAGARPAARLCLLGAALLAGLGACGGPGESDREPGQVGAGSSIEGGSSIEDGSSIEGGQDGSVSIPLPEMDEIEPQVGQRLLETRAAVERDPGSADAWGTFGMVAHAHELWAEAAVAYEQALALEPEEVRWPYYLGDVESVLGTDLESAEGHFLRALELKPGYGPTHMRLGQVLVAQDRPDDAEEQLVRALELAPDLQPARVGLAQVRLRQDRVDEAVTLLEAVLAEHPRHAQALSALGQAYNRLGRRDEARAIALRARDASDYNLYSDPLMSEVVAEGVSSVVVWERARAYLDNGNFEQAVLGLRQVLGLRPDDADVHHQLAYALEKEGDLAGSKRHLQRVVALDPERTDARRQLGSMLLDEGQGPAAVEHLGLAHRADPEDVPTAWLYGRALVLAGRLEPGLDLFRRTLDALGPDEPGVPVTVRNVWGSALAQQGQFHDALEHFEAALRVEPRNAQSLFYCGLAMEGLGRPVDAVAYYRRAMAEDPNPLVAGRLQALGEPVG